MKLESNIIGKALELSRDPVNLSFEYCDGEKELFCNGIAMDASLLLFVFQQGIADGSITVQIKDDWEKLNYWNRLVVAVENDCQKP